MNKIAGALLRRGHDQLRNGLWSFGHALRDIRRRPRPGVVPNRVLHVTSSFDVGGTQTQIKHLATASATRFEHRVTEMFPELNYLFRQEQRVERERYVQGGWLHRALGEVVVQRNPRGFDLVQVAKLVRDLEVEQPATVVGWGHENCVTTFLAATVARTPRVVFCIRTVSPEYGWTDPKRARQLRVAHRRMAPRTDAIVANSTLLQADYAEWAGIDSNRVRVCANGTTLDVPPPSEMAAYRARSRAAWGIPDDGIVVSNVGRFSKEKGQQRLVRAMALLPASIAARVTCVLCGDGATLADIQTLATSAGVTNVRFVGRTNNVWELLAASDIFVMPSDYEGMPNAMMEAMAAGLPCVSTTRSGIRDVARDGVEALYFEADDNLGLAKHLQHLVSKPEAASALGRAAAQRISQYTVARLVECFERAITLAEPPFPHH